MLSACQSSASRTTALSAGVAIIVSLLSLGWARTELQEHDSTAAVRAPFESGAWKADIAGARHNMAQDLIDRSLLLGKSRAEVKSLLGAPDREGKEFLAYMVYSGADNRHGPAYAVRVELDADGQRVHDAHVDTDTDSGADDTDMN
jgi:hypothetical protein